MSNIAKCLQELSDIAVTPPSPDYSELTKIYNPAYLIKSDLPAFVAVPTSTADVQRCIQSATLNNVPVALRSAGHCFAGYCTIGENGFVVNLSHSMKGMEWSDSSVTVQVGASWEDVYIQLDDTKHLIVGGCCPSVGLAGYILGGGYGLLSRSFGLGSDSVLKMTMVTADGQSVVRASPDENPDLYWGLCGGGGGNFGVLVDVTLSLHPPKASFTWMSYNFKTASDSEKALKLLGESLTEIPDDINIDMALNRSNGQNLLSMDVVVSNPALIEHPLLLTLRKIAGSNKNVETKTFRSYKKLVNEYALLHGYVHYEKKPVYMKGCFINELPPQLASDLINLTIPGLPLGFIQFVHVGGEIAKKPSSYSAYPHRQAQYQIYTYGQYANKVEKKVVLDFADMVYDMLTKGGYAKGCYVNYMDEYLNNWPQEYYGDNYGRLCRLKDKWNPNNNGGSLHFKQEIGSAYEP